MPDSVPVRAPAGFAPAFAIGQRDSEGNLSLVGPQAPLAVARAGGVTPAALEGQSGTPLIAGPFEPAAFSPVVLTLGGEWEGQVRVLRSVDNGVTLSPLTVSGAPWAHFASAACEAVWEESEAGATLWLDLAPTSGTIRYRLSQ